MLEQSLDDRVKPRHTHQHAEMFEDLQPSPRRRVILPTIGETGQRRPVIDFTQRRNNRPRERSNSSACIAQSGLPPDAIFKRSYPDRDGTFGMCFLARRSIKLPQEAASFWPAPHRARILVGFEFESPRGRLDGRSRHFVVAGLRSVSHGVR